METQYSKQSSQIPSTRALLGADSCVPIHVTSLGNAPLQVEVVPGCTLCCWSPLGRCVHWAALKTDSAPSSQSPPTCSPASRTLRRTRTGPRWRWRTSRAGRASADLGTEHRVSLPGDRTSHQLTWGQNIASVYLGTEHRISLLGMQLVSTCFGNITICISCAGTCCPRCKSLAELKANVRYNVASRNPSI